MKGSREPVLGDLPRGTRYRVHLMHPTPATKQAHEKMGFHEGWGTCRDQLVAYVKSEGFPGSSPGERGKA